MSDPQVVTAVTELAEEDILDLAGSFRIARAIYAAVQLGVAEALAEPLTAEQIAQRVGADKAATSELLRALASRGVFAEITDGVFARTAGSRVLLPAAEGGAKEVILGWVGHPAVYRGLECLDEAVRTGRISFEIAHGSGFFDWLGTHPGELAAYASSVGGEDPEEFRPLLDVVDFARFTVLGDIGGGGGGLVHAALERHEHLSGIVVELPATAARASALLASTTIAGRVQVVAADARQQIPAGPDCYVMSTVLRYFDDHSALDLLNRIRGTLPTGGQVVIVEMPQPPGRATAPHAMKSLVEYALSGGCDRTLDVLREMLDTAGFAEINAVCWKEPFWVIMGTT